MKKTLTLLALALLGIAAAAQPQGSITPHMLSEIRKGYEGSPADKAIRTALNPTSIPVLSANAENAARIDTDFSDRVETWG
ncbi:MAG: aminopeptidase, partial [Bacteroidales bacterium]|nr:aminopeptidase [Bacteroidales bacterium]